MEVVEQPVRRGRDELSGAHVVGQRAIGAAQHADVVLESRKRVARAASWIGIDGQAGGERQRTLLEPLDAQELVAQRLLGRGRLSTPKPTCRQPHEKNRPESGGAEKDSSAIDMHLSAMRFGEGWRPERPQGSGKLDTQDFRARSAEAGSCSSSASLARALALSAAASRAIAASLGRRTCAWRRSSASISSCRIRMSAKSLTGPRRVCLGEGRRPEWLQNSGKRNDKSSIRRADRCGHQIRDTVESCIVDPVTPH